MSADAEKAVKRMQADGMNCAQSILSVYGQFFGLAETEAIKVAAAFGGGMGRQGKTCGAVTGAFMVLGLACANGKPDSKQELFGLVGQFTQQFTAKYGSTDCSAMLGFDISTQEGMNAIRERGLTSTICPGAVKSAAELLETLLAGRLPR